MIESFYIPTPLEDFQESERYEIAKLRMNEYIEQNYREGGLTANTPLESSAVRTRMDRINFLRALWNNDIDEHRYDYLYQKVEKKIPNKNSGIDETITLEMPAKVRHIPIVRPKLESLISKELNRPVVLRVIAMNHDIVDRKLERIKDDILEKQLQKISQRQAAQSQQQQLINMQRQLMQQASQMPGMEAMIYEMQSSVDYFETIVQKDIVITEEEAKTIKKYYQYSHKEFEESLCSQALHEYYDRKRLRQLDNDAFEEQMITGEPIWFVDWQPGMDEPETLLVRPEFVWYQYNESAKFLHELDWIVWYTPKTYQQIVYKYGTELDSDDLEYIRNLHPHTSQNTYYLDNLYQFPNGVPVDQFNQHDYMSASTIDVYRVFWKEQVEVYAIFKKNDKPSVVFDKTPYFVKYITKEDYEEKTKTKARIKRMERKGEIIKKAYRVDLWEGTRIGDKEGPFVNVKKRSFQYRVEGSLSDTPLPFVGYANNRFYKANSPLWETRDIQELYNILHYQEELLIALSGVKGMIYDISQLPSNMTPQEMMYYRKQGMAFIETMHKDGRPKKTSFNQFQNFDDTLSPAVGLIEQVKESLKMVVADITGVTPQQQGQIAKTDQVGTYQMALEQSNVVTERYYQQHEELREIRDTILCNLFPYSYAEGKKGSYIVGKDQQNILNIQRGQLKGVFRAIVNNGSKEREIMQMAKQVATQKMTAGQLDTSAWLKLLDLNTMHEIQEMLLKYEDEAKAYLQQMNAQNAEQQKQAQMELAQMDLQFQSQLEQLKGQIQGQLEQIKGQVELRKEELKLGNAQAELQVKKEIEDKKIQVDQYNIDSERAVEEAYLNFQYTQLAVNDQNTKAQILINRAQQALELSTVKNKERIKD